MFDRQSVQDFGKELIKFLNKDVIVKDIIDSYKEEIKKLEEVEKISVKKIKINGRKSIETAADDIENILRNNTKSLEVSTILLITIIKNKDQKK